MISSTSYRDAITRPGSPELGVLFPALQKEFLIRQSFTHWPTPERNEPAPASLRGQQAATLDVLVRLPSLRESNGKVTVLQRWVGQIERVEASQFIAIISDATNPRNPPEEVELDLAEVSRSDLPLVAEGATFYWSIGYRDTPGGQRERISTLRLARRPRLSLSEVNRIFERADRLAAYLESD